MKKISFFLSLCVATFLVASCGTKEKPSEEAPELTGLVSAENFTDSIDGKLVGLTTIKNANGLTLQATNFGARVVTLFTPDKSGKMQDIVQGHDNLKGYTENPERYYGAAIGRYGNRIGKATFALNEESYTLSPNDNGNTLHGGPKGYHNVVWDVAAATDSSITFHYLSADGEEGYPGNLDITMVYTLTASNEFKVTYEASTDKKTVVNLTHHSYFNLSGDQTTSINNHQLEILADGYTPVDGGLIPTGEIAPVAGTPMDFTTPTAIGDRVEADFEQLKLGGGYDHNWALRESDEPIKLAAKVYEPTSGRYMEVWTDQPGIQFYGGNFIDGSYAGKGGIKYPHRSALCLETQHFPDSPNKPQFATTVLNPDETYYHVCIYKFGTK